jgi:hypothetical protein
MDETKVLSTIFATVKTEISEQRVSDLLCGALDPGCGGSLYWAGTQGYEYPAGKTKDDFEYRCMEVVLAGGKHIFFDADEDESNKIYSASKKEKWTLTREKLIKGLSVMASLKAGSGGHHWPNFVAENDDAETADVYLQCCLFGEIIYG